MRIIAAAAVGILLFSCRPAPDDTDDAVVIWAAMGPSQLRALSDIADRFERRTGLTVTITEIGLFEITTKLELAAPAGKGPDVVTIAHTSVGTLSLMGLLVPMDNLSGSLGGSPLPFVDAFRYRGSLMGVPLTVESYGLVVNKDLVTGPPDTWEALFAEAEAITRDRDGDSVPEVYGFLTDPVNFYFTFPFYDAADAYIFKDREDRGTDTTDLGFCTTGGIHALDLLTDLTRRRHIIPVGVTYPIITDLFSKGRLAMTIYGTYLIDYWEELGIPVGYYELPPFADGRRGRPLATLMGLGISAHGDNREGAERFITFLLLPENLRRFFEIAGGGVVMAYPAVYRDEDFTRKPYLSTALSIASGSYPFPNDPEGDLVWPATAGAAEAAVNGAATPEEALCGMQKRLEAVIAEMRR